MYSLTGTFRSVASTHKNTGQRVRTRTCANAKRVLHVGGLFECVRVQTFRSKTFRRYYMAVCSQGSCGSLIVIMYTFKLQNHSLSALLHRYSVSPNCSGVYPTHTPLYEAWKEVHVHVYAHVYTFTCTCTYALSIHVLVYVLLFTVLLFAFCHFFGAVQVCW